MNYKYKTIFIIILIFTPFIKNCLAAQNTLQNCGRLIVKISNLKPSTGVVRLGLYNSRTSYEKRKSFDGATKTVQSKSVTITFKCLPPGFYAIMFYHDKNNNGKFDRFFGIPIEKYGFSNNVRPIFKAPDFDKVKFYIGKGTIIVQELIAQ